MKKPRIGPWRALTISVVLGVAALWTYGPRVSPELHWATHPATVLCEKTPGCRSVQTRIVGTTDRSSKYTHVTFDFNSPPKPSVVGRLKDDLYMAGPSMLRGPVKVDYLVNGMTPQQVASAPKPRNAPVGGVKR